ncbi:MAG: acyl carrier protein [Motiliproteus sp.]|jgi:acyl carrier protein
MESSIISLVSNSLQVNAERWSRATQLLGAIPELDSMAIVILLGNLEEHFDIEFSDDEISAEMFETIGSLQDFLQSKL